MSNHYRRLGELLVGNKLITNLQLSIVLAAQATSNRRIGDILVERGFVTEEQIAKCLAEQYSYPLADIENVMPQQAALMALGPDAALSLGVLPIRIEEDEFACAIADPLDIMATDQLQQKLRRRIKVEVAPQSRLQEAIRRWYGLDEPIAQELYSELSHLPARFVDPEPRRRFGTVSFFDARDSILKRPVTLASVPLDTPEARSQFFLVQSAARANSPAVCSIYDWFEFRGHHWAVFDRLHGETLEHILRTRGPRAIPQAADLMATVAQGVDASNQAGGWCGLVCPSNVLIRRSGAVLVPFSTPAEQYSCPEIEAGETGTPASDVYALGTLLWESVIAKNPHENGWALPEATDEIPPALADVIRKCVDPEPSKRYASAIQLSTTMRAYNWFSVGAQATQKTDSQSDRDELLERISGSMEKPQTTIWQRLFGRKAA